MPLLIRMRSTDPPPGKPRFVGADASHAWLVAQATYERYEDDVRAQLDEASWRAALNEGLAMSLEQAIEYALEGT